MSYQIRDAKEHELRIVCDPWHKMLTSVRKPPVWTTWLFRDMAFRGILATVADPNVRVRVLELVPDEVSACAVSEQRHGTVVLHWVFCKSDLRNHGLATALVRDAAVEDMPLRPSMLNTAGAALLDAFRRDN